jgi:ABC-type Fe3+-hydroxamate transport system substrate-binding protein
MGEHADASSLSEAQRKKEVAMWKKYPTIAAAKNDRVHIVSSDLYVHPGPRVIELARVMAELFHPELKH